jgi:hypothetical protein
MLDIDRLSHIMPSAFQAPKISRPTIDPVSGEEYEGTNDDRTLAEVMKSKKAKTSQEDTNSPGGDLLPNHPKKLRATARKRKASASLGRDEDETPK